jgi:DNA (cytosine-5)-methyltransferase 1
MRRHIQLTPQTQPTRTIRSSSKLHRNSAQPTNKKHVVVGLFSGVGGIELGLHKSGHHTELLCENDPAARAVLAHRFPGTPIHQDVNTLKSLPNNATLLVAGFPCQDLSQAGKTTGISGTQSGLIEQVFRLLRKQPVPWLLLENVPFMLQLGRGRAMRIITQELEQLGYNWAYRVVDTRAFGLPQRRRRVYLVASTSADPRPVLFSDEALADHTDPEPNPHKARGFYWTEGSRGLGWAINAIPTLKGGSSIGIPSPPAILMQNGMICTPDIRDAERLQGFPKNWTKPAETVSKQSTRWKLVGNAVSVPVATWLGRRLIKPRTMKTMDTKELLPHHSWPTAAWNVGSGLTTALVSEWPVRLKYQSLDQFLQHPPTPLSEKATSGFLRRAEVAKLKFEPDFLNSVRAHLLKMQKLNSQSKKP